MSTSKDLKNYEENSLFFRVHFNQNFIPIISTNRISAFIKFRFFYWKNDWPNI